MNWGFKLHCPAGNAEFLGHGLPQGVLSVGEGHLWVQDGHPEWEPGLGITPCITWGLPEQFQ